jgi:integrase
MRTVMLTAQLFALKWGDVDFREETLSVTRSIAYGVVGRCKTVASQKPVPVHPILAETLLQWRSRCRYRESGDWVFANEHHRGRHPYWGQAILRNVVRPIAIEIGIRKRIGWHTFRHTYSTLLRSVGTEFKVMQELLRHSSLRSTMDIYTQAVTPAKQAAQAAAITLVFSAESAQPTAMAEDQILTDGNVRQALRF